MDTTQFLFGKTISINAKIVNQFLLVLLLLVSVLSANAQKKTEKDFSPRKASLLSAVIPGAGQIYNKKYWKVPIVFAAVGTSIYYIDYNIKEYNLYKTALIARQDDDPNTVDLKYSGLSDDLVSRRAEYYRRMRDISFIALAATYILNILDASVDAHLKDFDVSDDLTVSLGGIQQGATFAPALTLRKRF